MGRGSGLKVIVIDPVCRKGKPVSSTRIREAVARGRLEEAAGMLGRPFSILGTVKAGRAVGRTLGFPTANLDPHNEVLPPSGVYAVRARIGRRTREGVLYAGTRPTFPGARSRGRVIELHLFGLDDNLYGGDIEVAFYAKLRNETRFSSSEELRKQIARDARAAAASLGKKPKESLYTR
jgi:riboflavin kinase/FMN adenylyltransferase